MCIYVTARIAPAPPARALSCREPFNCHTYRQERVKVSPQTHTPRILELEMGVVCEPRVPQPANEHITIGRESIFYES